MYFKKRTTASTDGYCGQIKRLSESFLEADTVIIGAGSGLSAAAGLTYAGRRFEEHFSDFIAKYHFSDMYSAGFYPYPTPEEYWAYWCRHIYYNRYDQPAGNAYVQLIELIRNKDYFVITTNVDHQFQLAGIDKERLFYTQGDYGLWQCSKPCHTNTYSNEAAVRRMLAEQSNLKIPSELIPYCPVCGAPMTMNLRMDHTFVEDEGWRRAQQRYEIFLAGHQTRKILYLELGVGWNTPGIIKYPFWKLTEMNSNAVFASISLEEPVFPEAIASQSIGIHEDIAIVLHDLTEKLMPRP